MDQTQLQKSFQLFFDNLGHPIDWRLFSQTMTVHPVLKGEYLFRQGDEANHLYFLNTGLVRYVSVTESGKEFTQTFAQGPRIIGSTKSMVSNSQALFGIQAMEDCIIISYHWNTLFEQMRQDKGFLTCYCHFLEHIFILKEERENSFVKDSAEKRYLDFCVKYPDLKNSIAQQHIASYLGITPVALSRIRNKLKRNS
ncbi:Crp/Fnr family transcriptional regulator [Marinicellulosiphila megalodicopiae]|uniref:Crp/Fnr family transcriptional regulator n=1 Tax=Marinicellulosiphila megalodicopiae TaxID=2724896 RepID=UPI003BB11A57